MSGKVIAFPNKRVRRRMKAARQTGLRETLTAFVIRMFSTPPPVIWLCSPSCHVCLNPLQADGSEVTL